MVHLRTRPFPAHIAASLDAASFRKVRVSIVAGGRGRTCAIVAEIGDAGSVGGAIGAVGTVWKRGTAGGGENVDGCLGGDGAAKEGDERRCGKGEELHAGLARSSISGWEGAIIGFLEEIHLR